MKGKSFKPGDRVKVIAGPRAGLVTFVTSPLIPNRLHPVALSRLRTYGFLGDEMVHEIDAEPNIPGCTEVVAPPSWLEPWWDGKEAGEWTGELSRLCGIGSTAGVKEPA